MRIEMGNKGIGCPDPVVELGTVKAVKTDLRRGSGHRETWAGEPGEISLARGADRQLSDAQRRSSDALIQRMIRAHHIAGPRQRAAVRTELGGKSGGC